jgi:hypothetical protein
LIKDPKRLLQHYRARSGHMRRSKKWRLFDHLVGMLRPYMRSTVTRTLSPALTKQGSSVAREGLRQPQGDHEKNSEPAEKHAPDSRGKEKSMLPSAAGGERRDSRSRGTGWRDDFMRKN